MGVFDVETDAILCQKMEALYWQTCFEYNKIMHDAYFYITIVLISFILAVFLGILCAYFSERKNK